MALSAQWAIGRPGVYGIAAGMPGLRLGQTVYHPPSAPTGISPQAAALALAHREISTEYANARRALASAWTQALEGLAGVQPVAVPRDGDGGYLRFPVLVRDRLTPLATEWAATLGVVPTYPKALPRLPELKAQLRASDDRCDGAEHLTRSLLTLPTHWQVTTSDRERITEFAATHLLKSAV